MRIRLCIFASLLPLLAPACWMEEYEQDAAADAPELDELPAQPLPLEGSPTAYGMLRVANELGFSGLDDEVALDRQAAASIIAHRAGPDEHLGTPDDRYVEDLAELDSLYWLGEANLWRIQAHALLEGWVPEAVPEGCEPVLADALARCRAFMSVGITSSAEGPEPSTRCEVVGDAELSAAEYFSTAGLVGYLDPALGYHVMLCGDADTSTRLCDLGVAGLATHGLPECVMEAG